MPARDCTPARKAFAFASPGRNAWLLYSAINAHGDRLGVFQAGDQGRRQKLSCDPSARNAQQDGAQPENPWHCSYSSWIQRGLDGVCGPHPDPDQVLKSPRLVRSSCDPRRARKSRSPKGTLPTKSAGSPKFRPRLPVTLARRHNAINDHFASGQTGGRIRTHDC